jgi:hypothetical protein
VDFYRPRPGLNQRTLGPMASTLTITPLRTHFNLRTMWQIMTKFLIRGPYKKLQNHFNFYTEDKTEAYFHKLLWYMCIRITLCLFKKP